MEITLEKLLEDLLASGKDSLVKLIDWNNKTHRVTTTKIDKTFVIKVEKP